MKPDIASELRSIREGIEELRSVLKLPAVMLTRQEAAEQLRVSVRQLQRLIAAGRLLAHPSGIARAELERYAKTPQTPLPKVMTRPMRERSADSEADRLTEMLKARRKRAR